MHPQRILRLLARMAGPNQIEATMFTLRLTVKANLTLMAKQQKLQKLMLWLCQKIHHTTIRLRTK